ncbi:MAG: DUF5655 domain-containing protein [Asticcacaulis sp.]
MDKIEQALETQLTNIEAKTGKDRQALMAEILGQAFSKHGEAVTWLKETYALGHGDANTLAHYVNRGGSFVQPEVQAGDDPLDTIYSGKKADLRPIHEQLMAHITSFGDFEIAPKKGYVSLRVKKQFAMLGPKTNTRFELGLNLKEDAGYERAVAQPVGGMCQYIVSLSQVSDIDDALITLVKRAWMAAH